MSSVLYEDDRKRRRQQLDALHAMLQGPGFGRSTSANPLTQQVYRHLQDAFDLLQLQCYVDKLEEERRLHREFLSTRGVSGKEIFST